MKKYKHQKFSFKRIPGDPGQDAILNTKLGDLLPIRIYAKDDDLELFPIEFRLKRIFKWSNGNYTIVGE